MLADTPQGSSVGLSGRSGAAPDQTLEVLPFRHPVSLTPIGVPATPFGMSDGQRSEDLIPFASKGRLAGKPTEGGAELALAILGDPPSQVKQWPTLSFSVGCHVYGHGHAKGHGQGNGRGD
jgi:hypothetical protein